MSGLIIAIYKQPGVRQKYVGKLWRRLFAKCVMKFTGPEDINACKDDNICAGIKAGIDGSVQGVQAIWGANLSMENWIFYSWMHKTLSMRSITLECFRKLFHLWPSRTHFVFNFYCPRSSLVLRNRNVMDRFVHCRKGGTQGYPLVMVTYGIGVLPLTKRLESVFPDINQPQYADGTGALGTFGNFGLYFNLLKLFGPGRGYYP